MRALPLFLLAGCSDYNVSGDNKPTKGRNQDDTHTVDTGASQDSVPTDTTDSGGDTVTDSGGDSGTVEEPPKGKIDVVLLIDVAYWYDCYHADLAVEGAALINALMGSGANIAISVATFDDYNVDGQWYTAYGGLPYIMKQQLTTDTGLLLSAVSGLELVWGGDGPGTGFEAIAQATKGDGYDQDCNGNYDAAYDIKPFNQRGSDAFNGGVKGTANSGTPGTGTIPGAGWRDGSTRVVVAFAENAFRDRDEGHAFPVGSCAAVNTGSATIAALGSIGAEFLGVNAYEFQDEDPVLQRQLEAIANGTHSKIDADADGAIDDVAVLSGSWDWPATSVLVAAIWDVATP